MRTEFVVIDPIDATHEGPVVPRLKNKSKEQKAHLLQGALDGACGPYCLFMALIICGLVDRHEIISLEQVDGRTSLGKLIIQLSKYSAFFRDGTDLIELKELLDKTYRNKLTTEIRKASEKKLLKFVKKHVLRNHPVILGLSWKNGGHWVVVIGLEYQRIEKRKLCRLLVLDPGDPPSNVCAWNGVIDARKYDSRKNYPYEWWTSDDLRVRFDSAMALFRKVG